jgi:putative heme transporter
MGSQDPELDEVDGAGPDTLALAATPGADTAADPNSRRSALLRTAFVGVYLFVVFGVLLPRVVDYGDVLAAFAAAPPAWLLIVLALGIAGWVTEGLGIWALLPRIGIRRSVTAYLSMAAVGSTIPGPVKLAFAYRMFRGWGITPGLAALVLTLNGLAVQAGKLLLPAIAVLFLTIAGTLPSWGFLLALAISVPVALGTMVSVWILRSEDFARRVGAVATRATGAVMHRIRREPPDGLEDRILDFRGSARDLAYARAVPTIWTQIAARTMGYIVLLASMRAVGVGPEVIPYDVLLAVYAAVMVITLIPIAPGGAGLPELLYITFLTAYVGDAEYNDLIGAGVMLFRGVTWFLPIPVGYLMLWLERRRERRELAQEAAGAGPAPA